MSKLNVLNQTASEILTLSSRGYKIISKLGEGAYAKVYRSEFRASDGAITLLACKVIDTRKTTKNFATKFLPRELNALVKIKHPHIIHIHSIFQRKTKYYIFMRYAENGDLLDYILKHGAILEPQARFWGRQIALAIQYLHTLQIAHRDLKCENIVVTSNYNVKLCDFGFTRVVDENNKKVLSETFCGSLSYASPEILKGLPYDPLISDMWAYGIMIFTMLNKAMPFDDVNGTSLYTNQVNHRWKFRTRVVRTLSFEVKSMIKNLLEPDIQKRYKINDVVYGEWIAMESRLKNFDSYELAALDAAKKTVKTKQTSILVSPTVEKSDDDEGKKTSSVKTEETATATTEHGQTECSNATERSISTLKEASPALPTIRQMTKEILEE